MAACCVPRLTQPSTLRGMVKWVSTFVLSNNKMAMMYVGHIAAYRRTRSPGRLAWSEDRRLSGAGLRMSDESGELSKWLSHDDSTINIVIRIIIIIIIIIIINRKLRWVVDNCYLHLSLQSPVHWIREILKQHMWILYEGCLLFYL